MLICYKRVLREKRKKEEQEAGRKCYCGGEYCGRVITEYCSYDSEILIASNMMNMMWTCFTKKLFRLAIRPRNTFMGKPLPAVHYLDGWCTLLTCLPLLPLFVVATQSLQQHGHVPLRCHHSLWRHPVL